MTSYSSVHRFLDDRLADGAARVLNDWQDRPDVARFHDRQTGWFGAGTVRAVVAAQLLRNLQRGNGGRWLVLTEQPYPESSPDQRIDLWLQGPTEDQAIALAVCADFELEGAQKAYQALAELQPRKFRHGYLLFCADRVKVADWQQEIETNPHDRVSARGIGRRPASGGYFRHRRER